jgi:DNA-binding PadR family transcriptional regulator
MNRASAGGADGDRSRSAVGRGIAGVREVIDELRSPGEPRIDVSAHGDDVRAEVLTLLAERPRSGYEIVRVLEERGDGARTPRAGAVYPTLQLLADEGLTTSAETDGRRIHTLTTAGRAAAEAARDRSSAAAPSGSRAPDRRGAVARSGAQLAQAVALAAQTGDAAQRAETAAALDDARRRILAILARS